MVTLTELNVNRVSKCESSLKYHVCSKVKHKTKDMALLPDCRTVEMSKEYRERHHGRLKFHSRNLLTYLFLSQSDYRGTIDVKVPFF